MVFVLFAMNSDKLSEQIPEDGIKIRKEMKQEYTDTIPQPILEEIIRLRQFSNGLFIHIENIENQISDLKRR